eukprot:350351-Chlamydomonas_euryale.AAC.3
MDGEAQVRKQMKRWTGAGVGSGAWVYYATQQGVGLLRRPAADPQHDFIQTKARLTRRDPGLSRINATSSLL